MSYLLDVRDDSLRGGDDRQQIDHGCRPNTHGRQLQRIIRVVSSFFSDQSDFDEILTEHLNLKSLICIPFFKLSSGLKRELRIAFKLFDDYFKKNYDFFKIKYCPSQYEQIG